MLDFSALRKFISLGVFDTRIVCMSAYEKFLYYIGCSPIVLSFFLLRFIIISSVHGVFSISISVNTVIVKR